MASKCSSQNRFELHCVSNCISQNGAVRGYASPSAASPPLTEAQPGGGEGRKTSSAPGDVTEREHKLKTRSRHEKLPSPESSLLPVLRHETLRGITLLENSTKCLRCVPPLCRLASPAFLNLLFVLSSSIEDDNSEIWDLADISVVCPTFEQPRSLNSKSRLCSSTLSPPCSCSSCTQRPLCWRRAASRLNTRPRASTPARCRPRLASSPWKCA